MGNEEHLPVLTSVFGEVLERFAFMFADPADVEDVVFPDDPSVQTHMTFRGQFGGRLSLLVPEAMAEELAANLLGVTPGDPDTQSKARDALKELLNICCGRLLTELAGASPVFDLSVPEVSEATRQDWDILIAQEGSALFQIDDYVALLNLTLE